MIYSYARVSTQGQVDDGVSLDQQTAEIARFIEYKFSDEVVKSYQEKGVSGGEKFRDRPEGARIWASLKTGDTIIFTKIDRFSRSLIDFVVTMEDFAEKDIGIIILSLGAGMDIVNDPMGRMMVNTLAVFADFEKGQIRTRTMAGKADRKTRGMHCGGPAPFGMKSILFENGKKLVEDEKGKEVIELLKSFRKEGLSYSDISFEMAQYHGFQKTAVTWMRIYKRAMA